MEAFLLTLDMFCMIALVFSVSKAARHGSRKGLGLFDYKLHKDDVAETDRDA